VTPRRSASEPHAGLHESPKRRAPPFECVVSDAASRVPRFYWMIFDRYSTVLRNLKRREFSLMRIRHLQVLRHRRAILVSSPDERKKSASSRHGSQAISREAESGSRKADVVGQNNRRLFDQMRLDRKNAIAPSPLVSRPEEKCQLTARRHRKQPSWDLVALLRAPYIECVILKKRERNYV